VCVLTHDTKFDVPAIVAALETDVGYLGAMGSRRTHRQRLDRLRENGVSAAALGRLRSPIGLDLGARTAEEVAVSILGEIISVRAGRRLVRPLRETDGPIHEARAS
jgi:xanthine dehydrogenase accessory factor